jgi:hypothetical protein
MRYLKVVIKSQINLSTAQEREYILTTLLNGPYQNTRLLHNQSLMSDTQFPYSVLYTLSPSYQSTSHSSASSSFSKDCVIKTISVRGIEDSVLLEDNSALIVNRIPTFQENRTFSLTYWPLQRNTIHRCTNLHPALKISPGKTFPKHYWLILFPKSCSDCQNPIHLTYKLPCLSRTILLREAL